MTTIPASAIVNVTPNVLAAGGSALDLIGLLLTTSTRVPIDTVQSFATADAVSEYFGPSSDEFAKATIYFNGFENSNAKPGAVLFAQYNESAVGAYLRGGDLSALSLSDLQGISGSLSIVIDGVTKSGNPNLAAATSFSDGGFLIADALNIQGAQEASFTGSITTTTLTVSAISAGTLAVGQRVAGTGVVAGTYIVALASGTGGTGTYTVSDSQSALSASMTSFDPAVQYDSISDSYVVYSPTNGSGSMMAFATGTIAASLKLTEATGAVLSQGAAAATPSAFMTALTGITQNWASFTTLFDPDVSGFANKLLFAQWTSGRDDRFAYVCWDTDESPKTTVPAQSSLGFEIEDTNLSGIILVSAPDADVSTFVCGAIASIDFEQLNGRVTLAFRRQDGLTATVTDETSAANLLANGYNFYGAYATANEEFVFFYDGSVSGDFLWADSFVNEIWLNNALQLALMDLMADAGSIPFNPAGYAMVENAMQTPIDAAISFGAIRENVTLTAAQISAVNSAAGSGVAAILQTRGWYVKVTNPSGAVRAARGPLPVTLWYVDGQSVQSINLTSIAVQ